MSKKLTKEEFIKRAREVHGNKYDYSKVNYVNIDTKVTIICPIHGEFEQTPYNHLSGKGCSKCSGNAKLSKEEFIEKAREVHGDKYDYSKVNYVNATTKVTIICPIHGEFEQAPYNHLISHGCPKCGNLEIGKKLKLTTEEFIEKAREVHGDKYDYSKVNYVNNHTKVTIICPIHGEFEQTPNSHLSGHGCSECMKEDISLMFRADTEWFIEKAREVHGNKYDYSKVNYAGYRKKVTIICPEHGEFEQTPFNHLRSGGCPWCAGNMRFSTEEFIKKAREVHGNKYDYSKVNYVNNHTKVTIICPEHGEFEQLPGSHLRGSGCPKCVGKNRTTEEFIEKAREVHGNKYDYSKVNYVNATTKVTIICPIHGEFEQTPCDHLVGKGCPKCKRSILEEDIEKLLTINNILFEPQKTFDWLISIRKLPLDFYLPEYNIAIECQGKQHFQPVDYFGGEEGFRYRIENDKLKRDLCTEHGIKVIYYSDLGIDYPYEVFEDLDEILKIIKNI